MDKSKCKQGCKYWRPLYSTRASCKACHYLIDTDEFRGSLPQECNKFDNSKREVKRFGYNSSVYI